jgi:hypothetical protein
MLAALEEAEKLQRPVFGQSCPLTSKTTLPQLDLKRLAIDTVCAQWALL